MEIKPNDIYKLSQIANISLTQEEINLFSQNFCDVLSFLDYIKDTDFSEQASLNLVGILREDVAQTNFNIQELLSNAADVKGDHISVPLVMEDI